MLGLSVLGRAGEVGVVGSRLCRVREESSLT